MSKQWQAYARHVLDAAEKLRRIEQRGDLTADDILFDAALRNLQTLAEATQRLPDSIKQQYGSIPWNEISGFRNVLVHNYLGDIDPQTVLTVLQRHVPALATAVRTMLAADDDEQA